MVEITKTKMILKRVLGILIWSVFKSIKEQYFTKDILSFSLMIDYGGHNFFKIKKNLKDSLERRRMEF